MNSTTPVTTTDITTIRHIATTSMNAYGWHNVTCNVCGHLVAMSGAKVALNRAAKHELLKNRSMR